MHIINLTSKDYDEVVGSGLVLVDFWAGWCMPCRMVAPIIDELAAENEGSLTVAKVDIDNEETLATRNEITSIPTVILFKDGVEVKRIVGVHSKETYQAVIGPGN